MGDSSFPRLREEDWSIGERVINKERSRRQKKNCRPFSRLPSDLHVFRLGTPTARVALRIVPLENVECYRDRPSVIRTSVRTGKWSNGRVSGAKSWPGSSQRLGRYIDQRVTIHNPVLSFAISINGGD